jgi:hypothetical protein
MGVLDKHYATIVLADTDDLGTHISVNYGPAGFDPTSSLHSLALGSYEIAMGVRNGTLTIEDLQPIFDKLQTEKLKKRKADEGHSQQNHDC